MSFTSKLSADPLSRNYKKYSVIALHVIAIALTITAITFLFIKTVNWTNKHQINFQQPIVIHKPVYITKRLTPETLISQVKAAPLTFDEKQQIVKEQADLQTIVNGVYQLESSGGVHDDCKAQGKVNGYGYEENTNSHVCFSSHQEVQTLVARWFNDKLESGLTLSESLCLYNQGIIENSCTYSQNYHLINN